ncbi:DUF2829 domain-containing protein [Ancylobacter rudongensis]|uniref:Thoeris anti-defense 2-like domain-containing protein n=1 Tax=Ancylobacter rudongensis TaxID=177413 RepID=A0A1G4UPW3_9HYPH|nr:DUF2829 domain-containing protein [Ancylobacter rudongensis]SCW95607.1 Protein of unknown function [Ancylobacter rudongensis]
MNFGEALKQVKLGYRAARGSWNGKGMFVYLEHGSAPTSFHQLAERGTINGVSSLLFEVGHEGTTVRMPHLSLKAADGSRVTGWLASQTDLLAEDWVVYPG